MPRIVDLRAVLPAALGRIEFDLLDEGGEVEVVDLALRRAVLTVWRRHLGGEDLRDLVARFDRGELTVETSDLTAGDVLLAAFGDRVEGLARWTERLGEPAPGEGGDWDASDDTEVAASVAEFVLEGLHLGRRINRDDVDDGRVRYGG